MTRNLWDPANAVLRGKFIAIQSYLRKQIKSQINNLILHLKNIIKKVRRRKEIINIRAEINEIENKKIENINKTLNR